MGDGILKLIIYYAIYNWCSFLFRFNLFLHCWCSNIPFSPLQSPSKLQKQIQSIFHFTGHQIKSDSELEMDNNSENNSPSLISREKLEEVASWVSSTVVSAFFSSLDRFSCVKVTTADSEDEENPDEAMDRPLTYS